MDSDKVVGLAVKDGQLELRYGVDISATTTSTTSATASAARAVRSGHSANSPPAASRNFRRKTRLTNASPKPRWHAARARRAAYRRYERDGKTWLCGSRGLVIFPGKDAPALTFAALNVQRRPNPTEILREEAKLTDIPNPIPVARLEGTRRPPEPLRACQCAGGGHQSGPARRRRNTCRSSPIV